MRSCWGVLGLGLRRGFRRCVGGCGMWMEGELGRGWEEGEGGMGKVENLDT